MWGFEGLTSSAFVQRSTLVRRGVGDDQIRRAVRSGELVRLRRGSYSTGAETGGAADFTRRTRAVADLSPGYVVGGVSAAALWGAPLWKADLTEVTLIRPHPTGSSRTPGRRVRAAVLGPADIVRIDGLQLTSPTRTLIDVARWCSLETAVVAGDHLIRTYPEAASTAGLERLGPLTGVGRARAVFARIDSRAESPGESLVRLLLSDQDLPTPELQVKVFDRRGAFLARTDFGWPDHAVVLEFDGRVKYGVAANPGRDPADALFDEKIREDRLRACGVIVVRAIWADLRDPLALLDRIARALEMGARAVRAGQVSARFSTEPTDSPELRRPPAGSKASRIHTV